MGVAGACKRGEAVRGACFEDAGTAIVDQSDKNPLLV